MASPSDAYEEVRFVVMIVDGLGVMEELRQRDVSP
jgi:hypothetical protein